MVTVFYIATLSRNVYDGFLIESVRVVAQANIFNYNLIV
jgi:hypothetical protein